MRLAQEISIFNPEAIKDVVLSLSTSITDTAEQIELRASQLYATKGQIETVESRITQTAHTISMSVRGTASKNSGASISISLLDGNGNVISEGSGTIKIDGNVVFTDQLSTAGQTTINGSNIKSGTIKLGGANNGNGQLYVYNASNAEIGHWNKDGIYIKNGEIYQEKYVDSELKNAWLRVQSTEITGGYTGLGHTAIVDLADYEVITDPVTGQQIKEGTVSIRCTNGSVALHPDKSVYIQAKGAATLYALDSSRGAAFGCLTSTGGVVSALQADNSGMIIATMGGRPVWVVNDNGSYRTTTRYGTAFAPRGDGVARTCDIVNGLICNLTN